MAPKLRQSTCRVRGCKNPCGKGPRGGFSPYCSQHRAFRAKTKPGKLPAISWLTTRCIVWTGSTNGTAGKPGYGLCKIPGLPKLAHKAAWVLKYGSIPEKPECAHLCNNKRCVNVDHLALISHWANRNYPLYWPKGKLKLKGASKGKGKAQKKKTP